MICILKRGIIDWGNLNVFHEGVIMETVSISDQNIQLIDIRNTNKILNLTPEKFMDEDLLEILEGGV